MNVERLFTVADKLTDIILNDKIIEKLKQVEDNLQNQISQPNNAGFQSKTANSIVALRERLRESEYFSLSPGWIEIIHETGYDYLFGQQLVDKVNEILASASITPVSVKSEFESLRVQLNELDQTLTELIGSLSYLGFEKNTLKPGEGEVGYLIPRELVNNELGSLKKEISELEFILKHISEAATGEKQPIKVKTISSSEFLIYVLIGLNTLALFSKGLEQILNVYKKILEIKELRQKLSEKGVSKTKTKLIEGHVNTLMKNEIKSIVKDVMSNSPIDDDLRKNEVNNGLEIAFNKLANRIDKGVKVELRIEPLIEATEEKDEEGNLIEIEVSQEELERIQLTRLLSESAQRIKNFDSGGESILHLPE